MSQSHEPAEFSGRRQLLQLQLLHEIGLALNESLDPTHVAGEILQRAVAMVDARAGALLARDPGAGDPEVVSQLGLAESLATILTLDEVAQVWTDRTLRQVSRAEGPWHHLCLVPLVSRHEANGLLLVVDRERRDGGVEPFSEDDQTLLHAFGYQAGAALHNARLHHRLAQAYTELQAAQAKLAQLEQLRALGDLAADMVHALSHVLGIVIGRADLYLTSGGDPGQVMQTILATAETGQEVIERIRRCTRLGVGRQRLLVDLNQLVRTAADEVQALWRQRRGSEAPAVTWDLQLTSIPATWANPTDLQEVFANLFLNSLEAMPDGGRLVIASTASASDLRFIIRDTGTGMSDELLAKVFQPFFTTKEEVGTGLGLSIVYRIVTDHGGEVQAHSQPGTGTTFTVRLPVQGTPPEPDEGDAQAGPDH